MFVNLTVMFSRQSGLFFREEKGIFKEDWAESEKFLLDFIYKISTHFQLTLTWFSLKMTFSSRKNGPDCLENITVRFRNIQMYMNYDGVCLNVEVLKEID